MNVTMPSLAALLNGQDQTGLFKSITGKPAISAKLAHQSLAKQEEAERAAIAKAGKVERDMAAFRRAAAKATSLQDLLADPTVHRALAQAYEIDILGGNADRFAQIVASDPDDPGSLAARSRNKGMIALAEDLKLAGDGLGLLRDAEFQKAVEETLVAAEFEAKAASVNPAAGDAFYFERKAAGIEGPMDILANTRLRDVVYGALNVPDNYKGRAVAEQAAMLSAKLDFTRLADSDYVKKLSVDYLNAVDRQHPVGKPSLAAILQPSGTGTLFNTLA